MSDMREQQQPEAQAPGRTGQSKTGQSKIGVLLPVAAFALVAAVFGYALTGSDPSHVPSVFIGKPAPETKFSAVEGLPGSGGPMPGFATTDLRAGKVSIVNYWASWCQPCIQEHPLLEQLAARGGVEMFGANYKDEAADARRFLGRWGNPFDAVGADPAGRNAIEWGVYGVPETFVVNGAGDIVYRHTGAITADSLRTRLLPAIAAARKTRSPATAP